MKVVGQRVWFWVVCLILMTWGLPVAQSSAQAQPPMIQLSDPSFEYTAPWLCLNFGLSVDGLAGGQLQVAGFPYYAGSEEFIPNISGDPYFTTSSGFLTSQIVLDVPYDSSTWEKNEPGSGVSVCFNDAHFPLDEGGYEYNVWLEFSNPETGEVFATYDTVGDFDPLVYQVTPPVVRISYVRYDFEAVNTDGTPGIRMDFTMEVLGLADHQLDVQAYAIEAATQTYIESVVNNSSFTAPDGRISSFDSVPIPFEYSAWTDVLEDSQPFSLFWPYSHFPDGNFVWYPEILVTDHSDGTIYLDYVGLEWEQVEMNPNPDKPLLDQRSLISVFEPTLPTDR